MSPVSNYSSMGVRHKSSIILPVFFLGYSHLVIRVKDLVKNGGLNMLPKIKSIKFQSNSRNYLLDVIFNAGVFFSI